MEAAALIGRLINGTSGLGPPQTICSPTHKIFQTILQMIFIQINHKTGDIIQKEKQENWTHRFGICASLPFYSDSLMHC